MSRINRIKQQKLALPISHMVDSFNGRKLILQTEQITVCHIIFENQYTKPYHTSPEAQVKQSSYALIRVSIH